MPSDRRRLVSRWLTVWRAVAPIAVPLILLGGPLQFRRVAEQATGVQQGSVLCGDTDHDGLGEMILSSTIPGHLQWAVWEYQPMNRYCLVYSDTGVCPFPPGIATGNFTPWDIGDIDGDSLTDLLGYHICSEGGVYRFVLGIQESPDLHSYPTQLSWWGDLHQGTTADQGPCYFAAGMDSDSADEIFGMEQYSACNYVFENCGNNQNRLVWTDTFGSGIHFAYGDFDLDGRGEFVAAAMSSLGKVTLYECTGDDSYAITWMDTVRMPNGHLDAFAGHDVDQDGKPEFFISFAWYDGYAAEFHLLVWEMVGDNQYERREIAQVTRNVGSGWNALSKCGDIDADGVEEVIWTTASDVYIYKATGNDQYELVWQWQNPTQSDFKLCRVNIYDLNGNGYNEVVLSGIFGGSPGYPEEGVMIYELNTVQLVSPNGAYNLMGGDTCLVRWRTFTPPRCDSVSLFLRTDTTWNLDTIATGIPSTESTYAWVVPRTPVRILPCRVVVFAYGPGWQYDESDSEFVILPGIEEARPRSIRDWALSVSPNPARGSAIVSYDVPRRSTVSLSLYDASGRLIRELARGEKLPGRYEVTMDHRAGLVAGVHFIRLESAVGRLNRKLVVTEDDR